MILIALVVAFFIISVLIDKLYEDREEERNVNNLAKASMNKEKKKRRY